jgi:hypothetical protein
MQFEKIYIDCKTVRLYVKKYILRTFKCPSVSIIDGMPFSFSSPDDTCKVKSNKIASKR